MKRKWLLISLAVIVAVAVVWFAIEPEQRAAVTSTVGVTSRPPPAAPPAKPVCASESVPVGDCIPQRLAHLPPDPGEAGKLTIEGIDSDKDGVRDDIQRMIEERFGHSRRAVAALRLVAMRAQDEVRLGDSVSAEQAYELAAKRGGEVARCYVFTVGEEIRHARALEYVTSSVTNTRERFDRYRAFDKLLNNRVFLNSEATPAEACGYDPAALPN